MEKVMEIRLVIVKHKQKLTYFYIPAMTSSKIYWKNDITHNNKYGKKITFAITKTPPYADSIFTVTVLSFATETTECFMSILWQSRSISLFN